MSPPKHQAKISPGPYKVHTEWGKLMEDSREFKEIKQSCDSFSGENATFCWKQERLNYHWSVDDRKRFPNEKYPERSTKRLSCWGEANGQFPLRFSTFRNCVNGVIE